MDIVLVGLPGSGKSVVGRRIARRHDADFVDLDETIEAAAGRPIPSIFETEGEAGFRAREAAAVAALGEPEPDARIRRVVATGGGAVVDPRNRWRLYRGRLAVWLDARPEAFAQRLRWARAPPRAVARAGCVAGAGPTPPAVRPARPPAGLDTAASGCAGRRPRRRRSRRHA